MSKLFNMSKNIYFVNWKPFDFLGDWRLSFKTDLVRIIFPKEIIRKIKYSAFIFRFYHYWNIFFFIPPEQGRIFHIDLLRKLTV